jgi:RNA polymerase sigma-70 factor (ECF subfamily)
MSMSVSPQDPLQASRDQDRRRVCLILGGDVAEFRALVNEHYPLAHEVAFRVLGDPQDAEEVVQDAFVKIHQALDTFRGEASLKTWILRIVMRLSLNRRRDRARGSWRRLGLHRREPAAEFLPEVPAPATETPEARYLSEETRRRVRELIDQLPDPLREALILNSFQELSYGEIARILGVPLGTVSSRIFSARRKLLSALEQQELL